MPVRRVAIIGAGASGLCCTKHFIRHKDKFSVRVFEQTSVLGGTWVYSDQTDTDSDTGLPVHSSIYASLRTNIPKEVMAFPGFPFRKELPSFVHHSDMLFYLQQYAAHYNLEEHISFQTLVEKVTPIPCRLKQGDDEECSDWVDDVQWELRSRHIPSSTITTEVFDTVLVCNGHYFKPYLSEVPGIEHFPGAVVHSHCYRHAESFANQEVLVIGGGPSGRDISADLARHAKHVLLSQHKERINSILPPNLFQLPDVLSIADSGEIEFTNGEKHQVDSILLCTGYEYDFPFLSSECGVKVQDHRVSPLYKHLVHIRHPSMAFIGLNFSVLPFPYMDMQVRFILSVWLGNFRLPCQEQMERDSEDSFQKRLKLGLSKRKAHYLGPHQWGYMQELAELGGLEGLDPVLEKLYEANGAERLRDLVNYKDVEYEILDRETWRRVQRKHCSVDTVCVTIDNQR